MILEIKYGALQMVDKNSISWANFQALNMYLRVYFHDNKAKNQKNYFIGLVWNTCKMK